HLAVLSSCYRAHRDLPSFPTRRSSDLHLRITIGVNPGVNSYSTTVRNNPLESSTGATSFKAVIGEICISSSRSSLGTHESVECRSEEHTSELQSRENLVCRLLLEKKKK